jgi:hypothetical protein
LTRDAGTNLNSLAILPDIKQIELNYPNGDRWPAEDRFTTGIRETSRTNVLPTWVVFASQIFLDVYHTLRAETPRAFKELNLACDHAIIVLRKYFKYSQENRTQITDMIGPLAASILGYINRRVRADVVDICYEMQDNKFERRPFNLLNKHAILAGTMKFRLQLLLQEFGCRLLFISRTLYASTHLYNAAKQQ